MSKYGRVMYELISNAGGFEYKMRKKEDRNLYQETQVK